jgi:D-3-phosphoglycerate dehydrogenase
VDDYCLNEVADHAAATIYAHNRRLAVASRQIAAGEWSASSVPAPLPPGKDPVGVAGFGRIGRETAKRLLALGFPVHVWDPYIGDTGPDVVRHDTLGELSSAVNHLTLHIPLTDESRGVVGRDVLAALGPGGHLVNTARGGLVDETALSAALADGTLGFASLDVLATEPPTGLSTEIAAHPRVLVTPHLAYLSTDSLPSLRSRAAEILRDLLEKESAR